MAEEFNYDQSKERLQGILDEMRKTRDEAMKEIAYYDQHAPENEDEENRARQYLRKLLLKWEERMNYTIKNKLN